MKLMRMATVGAVALTAITGIVATAEVSVAVPPSAEALRGQIISNNVTTNGATVYVEAWPNQTYLTSLADGATVPTYPLVNRWTADGRFTVYVDYAVLPAQYRDSDGNVELQIRATDGVKDIDWGTSVHARADGTIATSSAASSGFNGVDSVQLDIDRATATLGSGGGAAMSSDNGLDMPAAPEPAGVSATTPAFWASAGSSAAAASSASTESVASPQGISCLTYTKSTLFGLRENFAVAYGWSGAKVTVDFDSGSSHTMGGALLVGGKWSANSTKSVTYGAGATAANIVDARVMNRVNYRDYGNTCSASTTTWRKPLSVAAPLPSAEFTRIAHYNYTAKCNSYGPGATAWKQSTKNGTFGTGIDLGPLAVSAQSGWNSATKMQYVVSSVSALCGSTAYGWASSPHSSARAA
jgi:hypothetical protein